MPKARDQAKQLLSIIAINQNESAYGQMLEEIEETCREAGRRDSFKTWVGGQMRHAFDKWKAVYLALRARNGDNPPPEPFYYSGPYLRVLQALIVQQDTDPEFTSRLVLLGKHAAIAGADKCVMFNQLFDTYYSQIPLMVVAQEQLSLRNYLLNDLYQHYLYGDRRDEIEHNADPTA